MIKIYLKSYLYLFISILILTIILSIINYFSNSPLIIFKILIPIISIFLSTIILGKNCKEKAYLEGIKFSSIFLIFVTIFKILFKIKFNIKLVILYLIILIIGIIGSTIGIHLKKS